MQIIKKESYRKTVLVVDDEDEVRGLIKETLLIKYHALDAYDFVSAMNRVEVPIDAAVLDYYIPVRNGLEILSALRETQPELPAIIITAHNSQNVVSRVIGASVTDLLIKPFSLKYLLERVSAILGDDHCEYSHVEMSNGRRLTTMDNIAEYIEMNYMDYNLTLEKAASLLDIRKDSFCRAFKNNFGQSFTDYLNRVRIRNAAELLKGHLSIAEIAFSVGYASLRHFNNEFKLRYNVTPSEYRTPAWTQLNLFSKMF